jgi:hypothetical protein
MNRKAVLSALAFAKSPMHTTPFARCPGVLLQLAPKVGTPSIIILSNKVDYNMVNEEKQDPVLTTRIGYLE